MTDTIRDGPRRKLFDTAHNCLGASLRRAGANTGHADGYAVRESEKRYRRIVETTNEGVWLLDLTLYTSYVNRQLAEMLGYEPAEMVGRSVLDFYFFEDVEHKKQALERRQQGLREQIEERLRRRAA